MVKVQLLNFHETTRGSRLWSLSHPACTTDQHQCQKLFKTWTFVRRHTKILNLEPQEGSFIKKGTRELQAAGSFSQGWQDTANSSEKLGMGRHLGGYQRQHHLSHTPTDVLQWSRAASARAVCGSDPRSKAGAGTPCWRTHLSPRPGVPLPDKPTD